MTRDAYRPEQPGALVPALLVLVTLALAVAGFVLDSAVAYLGTSATAIVLLAVLARRMRRVYVPFFRRWKDLSQTARDREQELQRARSRGRAGTVLLLVASVAVLAGGLFFALRTEVTRGADLTDPGTVFLVYNRVAAPELAQLIDLFVVRGVPLEQADAEDLRLLRNLYFAVEGYSFTSDDLVRTFRPLLWYHPYRAYPNDINALPPPYREAVERILRVERSR